ncbi:MAG TPA: enolase C-terminal domain-like protein [Planctomycetaceae bacterium]
MRLVSLTAHHARIPLKRAVKHASHARRENDTLFVRAELDDGTVGWGEGLPRLYVTGETIESCFETLAATDLSPLAGPLGGLADAITACREFRLPEPPAGRRDCFGNTVRCAVELAVLDAAARAAGVPLSGVTDLVAEASPIRRRSERVRYGTAVTSVKPWKEAASALAFRLYGFEQCKVKVGVAGQDEPASLCRIRRWAGSRMDLRVDANEAWPCDEIERRVEALRPFGITAVEQPVADADVGRLAAVRPRLGVPVMLDESLCSLSDADRAISERLCDLFNIRLSKCGGFVNSLFLAAKANAAGLGYQLGCMVGETGILSAAGRHFACSVGGLRYLEGSFDRHLIAERLTKEDLTFGRGGLAPALEGPGLGVTIDTAAVERVTVRREMFRMRT